LFLASTCPAQKSPATLPDAHFLTAGSVLAIAQQDDGKVIVGGYFSLVNGVSRTNIARVNADGTVDPTWNPEANDAVRQIAVSGTDVFVLGDFSAIGGQSRNGIAKLSTGGPGAADPVWNPNQPGNLHALAVSGTNVFVGGLSYLAKFTTTGTGEGESPWGPQPDINIFALAVQGTDLYVGGNFGQLGGLSRNRLGKVSTLGAGDVDPVWDADVTGGNLGYVPALVATENYLYVGGSFDQVGGVSRKNIARLSLDGTGAPDPAWDPSTDRETVYAVAVNGGDVYVGGSFSQIGGVPRSGLAKLSATGNGAADPSWNAHTGGKYVYALTPSGSSVLAGGAFTAINGVVSLSVAKLSPGTGARDNTFLAQVGNPGRELAVARQADGKVIVGGDFYLAGGLPCQNLARFNADGTLDNTWVPRADGPVTAIVLQDANVFIAGNFSSVGGQSRSFLAKLDATGTGQADEAWNPNLSVPVDAFAIETTNLFVASSSFPGSETIVKLSTTGTGQRDSNWNPGVFECSSCGFGDKLVRSLAVDASNVYVGGDFDAINAGAIGSIERRGLAKLSATGSGTPDLLWDPALGSGVRVLTLDDTNLYVAGLFGLVRVSTLGTGVTDPSWQPDLVSGSVTVMAVSGTNLFAGGSVTTASGLTNAPLVRLSTSGPGTIDPAWNPYPHRSDYPSANVNLAGLAANGMDVYVVGDFDTIGGATRSGFAYLAVAQAPVITEAGGSTIFISRNPLDGPEVTHFGVTEVLGGSLYLASSLAAVKATDFITVDQGEAGLRFIGDGGARSITAVSAVNPSPDGAGSATTTLVLTGESGSSLLQFSMNEGLTLLGIAGRTYQVQQAENLSPPLNWLPLTVVTPNGIAVIVPGTRPGNKAACFYRATLVP